MCREKWTNWIYYNTKATARRQCDKQVLYTSSRATSASIELCNLKIVPTGELNPCNKTRNIRKTLARVQKGFTLNVWRLSSFIVRLVSNIANVFISLSILTADGFVALFIGLFCYEESLLSHSLDRLSISFIDISFPRM